MAQKYEKVDAHTEKLKRLYDCSSLTQDDCQYLNFQYERYKNRNLQVVTACAFLIFGLGWIPIVHKSSNFKYYTTLLFTTGGLYKFLLMRNNEHIEQICTPYFEKYKVK